MAAVSVKRSIILGHMTLNNETVSAKSLLVATLLNLCDHQMCSDILQDSSGPMIDYNRKLIEKFKRRDN